MKITPEIEAVARALFTSYKEATGNEGNFGDLKQSSREEYYKDSIAAIRALREPSDHMIYEGVRDLLLDEPLRNEDVSAVFRVMIDAALGGNK